MSIFQTTSNYVSELSVKYDEHKERFLGEFTSSAGVYRIEAVNMADLAQEMEGLLREEYRLMQKEMDHSRSRGRGGGGGSSGGRSRGGSTEAGQKVYTLDSTKGVTANNLAQKSLSAAKWADRISGSSGPVAFAFLIGDMYEGVESLWSKPKKDLIFAASFGGILITAKSRHQLRKKIWRQKNRRIHHIMMHVRKAGKLKGGPHDESILGKKIDIIGKDRLKKKKKRAQFLRPKSWEMRIAPQGQETGWRNRSLSLRNRLDDKKARSKGLWENKLILETDNK